MEQAESLIALKHELLLAQGKYDALCFVINSNYDASLINNKIQEKQKLIFDAAENLKQAKLDNIDYDRSYLEGLEEAVDIITKNPQRYNSTDKFPLREFWFIEGRKDAFLFAVEQEAQLSLLEVQVQKLDQQIYNSRKPLIGGMLPGMSPRIYKDGYYEGLKDALAIIEGSPKKA